MKTFLIWFFAFIFTAGLAVYQRMTGPTYPVSGKVVLNQKTIQYKLIRTYDGTDGALVTVTVPDTSVKGEIKFRRFSSNDEWTIAPMMRDDDELSARLPQLDPAGKVMYSVTLTSGSQRIDLTAEPAVLRYKGYVPAFILIPHILFIFLAMLFSSVTGLEALFKGKNTYVYTWLTVITLLIGGLIFGPIVQKYSFNVYWSGWPFGHDLTDNKSLVAFIFWIVALVVQMRNRSKQIWAIVAAVVLLIVFLIPHSMLGSQIDYTKEAPVETTR
ncbi:MAG: hypothetical protein ACM3N9_01645 [Syntrophothermus sp.]